MWNKTEISLSVKVERMDFQGFSTQFVFESATTYISVWRAG